MPVNQKWTDTTGALINIAEAGTSESSTLASNAGGTGAATETIVFVAPNNGYISYVLVHRVTVTPISAITGAGTHWNILSVAQYKTTGSAYSTPPAGTYTTQASLGKFVSKQVNTSDIVLLPGEILTLKNTGNDSTGAAVPACVINVEYSIEPYL